MKKITDIDPEIKKKIIEDREKDYGDYNIILLSFRNDYISFI